MTLTLSHPLGSYEVIVREGAIEGLADELRARSLGPALTLVSDERVAALHAFRVQETLEAADFEVELITLPEGERHKTLETLEELYDELADLQHGRERPLLAFGGGVIGDLVGFAAATWMRGVPLVQLPTSLLAMVDSSVGGKVAVDLPQGKNLVGAFKFPELVVADPELLCTLDPREWRQGLAELVKHGIIAGGQLFADLEAGAQVDAQLIRRAIEVKAEIVTEDPFESGRRRLLNLGHTFGHAIELLSDFTIPHGDAVSRGCALAVRLAERRGLTRPGAREAIEGVLVRHGLEIDPPPFSAAELLEAMALDKKALSPERLRLVLPLAPGEVVVHEGLEQSELEALL